MKKLRVGCLCEYCEQERQRRTPLEPGAAWLLIASVALPVVLAIVGFVASWLVNR